MASTPDQASEGALSTATNGIPAKPGPQCKSTNTTDNVPMTLMDTVRIAPMPGAVLTGDASEATSKTDKSTSKTKIKKAGIMCPGKSTTARNLYAINFLKDHQTYTWCKLKVMKKKTAGSMPA
ncbi:hypothetical protein H4582DRAFT_2064877 [Lactarius indigo]|nr:hypothetical protein H4582DRAFT_2064877 [Lactarius indigo]